MCNFRLVLTFSHEIIRTGKGALGGREGGERRRSWRPAPVSRERNLKHGKKSKTIGSFKVVDGLRPRMQYARERRGEGEGKRVCSGEKVGEGEELGRVGLGAAAAAGATWWPWQVAKETPVPLPATTAATGHPTIHSAKHGFLPQKSLDSYLRQLLLTLKIGNRPITGGVERERG